MKKNLVNVLTILNREGREIISIDNKEEVLYFFDLVSDVVLDKKALNKLKKQEETLSGFTRGIVNTLLNEEKYDRKSARNLKDKFICIEDKDFLYMIDYAYKHKSKLINGMKSKQDFVNTLTKMIDRLGTDIYEIKDGILTEYDLKLLDIKDIRAIEYIDFKQMDNLMEYIDISLKGKKNILLMFDASYDPESNTKIFDCYDLEYIQKQQAEGK